MKNRAFTLIELLVVVLIIGILVAIALPQYRKAVTKARFVQAKAVVSSLIQAQEVYYMANNAFATSFEELDVNTPGSYTDDSEVDSSAWASRTFPWGSCSLWKAGVISCRVGDLTFSAVPTRADHVRRGKQTCSAFNLNDTSIENQICRSETGRKNASYTGDGYKTYVY